MLTASVVTFHTSIAEIHRVLDCILNSPVNKIYIIDNSSNDALRSLESLSSRIRYIHSANVGYGGAHNIAIREAMDAGSDYHVVINPDIYFAEGSIERLVDYMETHIDVGWVMPRVEYPDGRLQYLCKLIPTPVDMILRRFFPKKMFARTRAKYELRACGYDREMNVPILSGCFMFVRIAALRKVGLFDERFFIYAEDVDLSRRMHVLYKTMYYPAVTIIHAHRQASYKSRKMLWVHIWSLVKYFNKWGWIYDNERKAYNERVLKNVRSL